MKPAIAVLAGGHSAERDISLRTADSVMQALKALDYPATFIDHDAGFVEELRRVRPALVFNALHGGAGEDGTVQAILEWLRMPYQGSGVGASATAMDKWLTKALLASEGLPAPRGARLPAAGAHTMPASFAVPCVVKPRAQGSAIGVSVVRRADEWPDAVRAATFGDGEILVEEYIEGREFTVAILEDQALPVVEITPHDGFYTYKAKYTPGGSTHTVPADLPASVAQTMQCHALALHRALGARDYSRVDIMLDAAGHMAILECNTLPGLTPLSLFPDAARAAGLAYEELVERLLVCAGSRRRT